MISLPLLFAVTLSIITSNIYTRLAACNCISITFWSGDLPSPLMAIFYAPWSPMEKKSFSHRMADILFFILFQHKARVALSTYNWDVELATEALIGS